MFNRFFKKKVALSANDAKERLQIIFAHNSSSKNNGWTEDLQKELMAVISKYVDIGHGNLEINVDKKDSLEILKINVSLSQTH